MPKIIIREYDNTTAGNVDYKNFSVVVPGYLGTPAAGKDPAKVFDENGIYECSSKSDFVDYVGKRKAEEKAAIACEIIAGSGGTKTEAEWANAHTAKDRNIYTRRENETHEVGYLKDADWIYTLSTEYSATAIYTIIMNNKVGSDAVRIHYGNQIAYELLGLGYTVLFKKLTNIEDLKKNTYWDCLRDKSVYDFRYVCTGGFYDITAYDCIYDLVNRVNSETLESTDIPGRGDAIALIDVDETGFKASSIIDDIKWYIKKLTLGKYAAIFCPQVTYVDDKDAIYDNLTFPASFHYLACAAYAKNKLNFNEWYAIAGYTRGVCDKTIEGTSFKLGEIAINALQPRTPSANFDAAVNLITNIRGTYYIWGNRTAFALEKDGLRASHFLNIRQLCCTLKKEIYNTCKKLTFNPNSDVLWGDFCNALRPILEKMKADQGISDYKIIKVKDIRKALLTAKIRIVPIEAVEDFDISIYLEDSISGVKVGTDED